MRVLDLGGTPEFWLTSPERPLHVTTLNLEPGGTDAPWITHVVGDACDPPLRDRFDVVISNSLLEHVGGHVQRQRLADVVHQFGDRHWVQTPYRYFPVEPHFVAPGFQYLPVGARAAALRKWPLGHRSPSGKREATAAVLEIELVSISELRHYFPTSRIWFERFGGLVKSLVAIRDRKSVV